MQLKNLNKNGAKQSSNNPKTQNSNHPNNNDNNTVNTKPNEDSDDDFPSDSDSDPIFSINGQSAAAQQAQSSSCWDGIVSIFSSCFAQKTTSLEFGGIHIIHEYIFSKMINVDDVYYINI